MKNTCDFGHDTKGVVKLLPYNKNGGNVITCLRCFLKEMLTRKKLAVIYGKENYEFPKWSELKLPS